MHYRILIDELRKKADASSHQDLMLEAADKLEWIQRQIDNSTNDHFTDTLDYYFEQYQELMIERQKLIKKNYEPLIDKEYFVEVVNQLKKNSKYLDRLNDVFKEFSMDNLVFSTGLEDVIVKLLETMFYDSDTQWISYWVWELDFGAKYTYRYITDENDKNIGLKTTESLYDFLLENMKNKNMKGINKTNEKI